MEKVNEYRHTIIESVAYHLIPGIVVLAAYLPAFRLAA